MSSKRHEATYMPTNQTHAQLYPDHYRGEDGRCGYHDEWRCHAKCRSAMATKRTFYFTVNDSIFRRRIDDTGSEHQEFVAHARTWPLALAIADALNKSE